MKFIDPKTGWKTYVVCAIGFALGVAQAFNIQIPSYVDWGLAFLGLGALRNGVKTQSAQLIETILASVTTADPNSDTTGAKKVDAPVEVHVLPPVQQ